MKKITAKFVNIIAAIDIAEGELVSLLMEIKDTPIRQICDEVDKVRRRLVIITPSLIEEKSPTLPRANADLSSVSALGERVTRLLREEAGLTASQAASELRKALVKNGLIRDVDVPEISRKSFSDWIDRLSKKVKEKDILNIATIVRNRYVHGPVVDWNLSKK
jgi:hypothetical protein